MTVISYHSALVTRHSSFPLAQLDRPREGGVPIAGEALDPKARALFKRQLAGLRNGQRTVFFSSHALGDIEQLCDRLGVVHEGRLRFVGTPADFKRAYGGTPDLEQAFLACIAEPAAA